MNLKETLNLPDADFTIPMKANLAEREPAMQARWDQIRLYHLIQASRAGRPAFTLHDGPPYTNSPIHIGTGLNKILKDFVVKSRTMMGFRAPYVPGFDNHGLPIEQAVIKKLTDQKVNFDIPQLRDECRKHAEHYIQVQTEQFKRLGVLGLWENPYSPMRNDQGAEIVRIFGRLVEHGYVYRGLRPVMWSPTLQTALADTEIIYKDDYESRSIYVKFPLRSDPHGLFTGLDDVACVIWTTTPWTIPANLAVAFHPEFEYVVARTGRGHLIVLGDLLEATLAKIGIAEHEVVRKFKGSDIEGAEFTHPIYGRVSLAVLADYVTTEDGTGIVHTAPGHGREDFATGQKYGLDILCPVDARGILTEEAGEFAGIFYKKCDEAVINRLDEVGALLFTELYKHKYPHAERDNQPVIFRATEQWFISMDAPFHLDPTKTLREKMLEEVESTKWYPASSQARMRASMQTRPDWCVSRQRPWGIGIPMFFGAESGEPVFDPAAIEAVAKHIEEHGSTSWFTDDPTDILPAGYIHPLTGETQFRKEQDVFDVWFDSACTHLVVFEGNVESAWKEELPADAFLEGSDQHRGWFNVSLVVGTAARGDAPYKSVITHGFVVDPNGQKMSKRLGNVVDPVAAANQYGADILRYWAASVNYENDVPCSDQLLKVAGENYRSIRNTLRFLLGNLYDYNPNDPAEPSDIDRWIMQQSDKLVSSVIKDFERYEFNQALAAIHNFCVNELSRFYLDAIKDTMYADGPDWPTRRGAQRACHYVLLRLTTLIATFLPHTADEVYERIPHISRLASVHMERIPGPEIEPDAQLAADVATMLDVRTRAFTEFELRKESLGVKNSQELDAELFVSEAENRALDRFGASIANLFKMANVRSYAGSPSKVMLTPSRYLECARSRVRRPDVELVDIDGQTVPLSARDRRALGL